MHRGFPGWDLGLETREDGGHWVTSGGWLITMSQRPFLRGTNAPDNVTCSHSGKNWVQERWELCVTYKLPVNLSSKIEVYLKTLKKCKSLSIFKLFLLKQGRVHTCLQSLLGEGGCFVWPKSDVAKSPWQPHACGPFLPASQRRASGRRKGSIQGARLSP